MSKLTIVMYHYVRDLERSRFPAIKGRGLGEFMVQLDYIASHYRVVTAEQIMAAVLGMEPLPPNALWLTFDDGYIDHYTNVFPLLHERGWQGSFFPPSRAILDGELLDVNKIHFILASAPSIGTVVEAIRAWLPEQVGVDAFDEYWLRYAKASRYDPEDVIFVKRLLQHALPAASRVALADMLFARFVSRDQGAFAAELYMSSDQLKTMIRSGQYVGSHGARHDWLNTIDPELQARDIDESLDFVEALGAPVDKWIMCYPYGAYNESLLDILRNRGCVCGITTRIAVADLASDGPLVLPRLDTNDLPLSRFTTDPRGPW